MKINYVVDLPGWERFWDALTAHRGAAVVDLETTGLSPYETWSRVACLAVALPTSWDDPDPQVWAVSLSHPEASLRGVWRQLLTDMTNHLLAVRAPLINQNISFDLKWVRAMTGVDLSYQVIWDTAMASRLLQDEGTVALKPTVSRLFHVPQWDDKIDFHQYELDQRAEERASGRPPQRCGAERAYLYSLLYYCALDTYWTWKLACMQREIFASWDEQDPEMRQLGVLNDKIATPTVRAITRMSGNGLLIDRDWMSAKRAELENECAKLDTLVTFASTAPCPTYEPASKLFRDWADEQEKAGFLRAQAVTPTGKVSWAYACLVANRQQGFELGDLLIQYRKAAKQTQMLDSWEPHIGADGRARPNYNLYRTVTGRLSSSEPNAQNLSKALHGMVVARPGYVIMNADLSQAELRIAAFVSGCRPMIEALQQGKDLHRMVAAAVTGKPLSDITKKERQAGKAVNFGFVFCMREETFTEYAAVNYDVAMSYEEAVAARQAYLDLWEGLSQWHTRVEDEVLSTGYVKSPIGRMRRPSGVYGDYRMQHRAVAQATNAPVQSFVSDIIMTSLDLVTTQMPWVVPVACVHDSIVLEVPEDRVVEAVEGVRERMTGELLLERLRALGCALDVPLVCDVTVGPRWGEGVEK